MTHDSRERVEILRDGRRLGWARIGAPIAIEARKGGATVRGTRAALKAAGVDVKASVLRHLGYVLPLTVEVTEAPPPGSVPRPSGSATPEAARSRKDVALTVRVPPETATRLRALAAEAGETLGQAVTRLVGLAYA